MTAPRPTATASASAPAPGLALPAISVVTSCFNAAEFVESTILSVVQQRYPKLQYVFVDGASTDDTLAIAQRHRDGIDQLICEPDAGQYHGIQKGLMRTSGEVMAWLNGDDIYCPWTLSTVAEIFARFPEVEWLIGTPSFLNGAGQCVRVSGNSGSVYPREFIRNGWFQPAYAGYLQQESMFWRRSLWDRAGGLDLSLKLAADFELWTRFARHAPLYATNVPLAMFRQRPGLQRSSFDSKAYEAEVARVCAGLPQPPALWRLMARGGLRTRHLSRMMVWRRGRVIAYSVANQRWQCMELRRPLARTSVADLLLESALRR